MPKKLHSWKKNVTLQGSPPTIIIRSPTIVLTWEEVLILLLLKLGHPLMLDQFVKASFKKLQHQLLEEVRVVQLLHIISQSS